MRNTVTIMKRYEWSTTPSVLSSEFLTQVAEIGGGYTVTYGNGGWIDKDTNELYEEAQATLRVDDLSSGHAALISGLILRRAKEEGELSIWLTVTSLEQAQLLLTERLTLQ